MATTERHPEKTPLTLMFRAHKIDGTYIVQADLSSISVSIYKPLSATPVVALQTAIVPIATTVYDTLQTGNPKWEAKVDEVGFNFMHTTPASWLDTVDTYFIEFNLTPVSGDPIPLFYGPFATIPRYTL